MISVEKNYIDRFYSMVLSETDKMQDISTTLYIGKASFETEKLPGKVTQFSIQDYVYSNDHQTVYDLIVVVDNLEPSPEMALMKHRISTATNDLTKIIYLGVNPDIIKLPYILSKHTLSPEDTNVVLDAYVVA